MGFPKGTKRKLSKQHAEILRQVHLGNKYTLGRRHTQEEKDKIRKSMLGHFVSAETRKKMSIASLAMWKWNKAKKNK